MGGWGGSPLRGVAACGCREAAGRGAACAARALIGNVLRDRELRCPADDWGRMPVVCGIGTFWMGNAVLDWRPPVFRAAVEAGQCRLVGVGAGAVFVVSRRLPTRRRGSALKPRTTRGSQARQTRTTLLRCERVACRLGRAQRSLEVDCHAVGRISRIDDSCLTKLLQTPSYQGFPFLDDPGTIVPIRYRRTTLIVRARDAHHDPY